MSFIQLLHNETCPSHDRVEGLLLHADGHCRATVERLESQWTLFSPLAEPGFIKKFRRNPHKHWWEMYLGSELVRHGLDPRRSEGPNGEGPDFIIQRPDGPICIEAVCPGRGEETNPDRVPPMVMGEARLSPDEEMTLRIYNSIVRDKAQSFRKYLNAGVVSKESRNIVAVSCSELDFPSLGAMAGSVFPIGPLTLHLDETGELVDVRHARKNKIERRSGSSHATTGFVDGTLSQISAAIFYTGTLFNSSTPPGQLFLLQNPTALQAFPKDGVPFIPTLE